MPCADDREGPAVPRPAGVAATPSRNWLPAAPAPRAALPREDTTGSNATEERGSKNAMRLSSVRENRRFPACSQNASRSADIAGNRRFPACSQNAVHSDDIAGRRPASGQNPQDSGNITRERRSLERQRVPGSEATESPRAVRAGRARRFHRLEFAARSAAHGPRADVERAEGFLDPGIPYLNTTGLAVVFSYEGVAHFGGDDGISERPLWSLLHEASLPPLARPRCASGRPRSRSRPTSADRPALA